MEHFYLVRPWFLCPCNSSAAPEQGIICYRGERQLPPLPDFGFSPSVFSGFYIILGLLCLPPFALCSPYFSGYNIITDSVLYADTTFPPTHTLQNFSEMMPCPQTFQHEGMIPWHTLRGSSLRFLATLLPLSCFISLEGDVAQGWFFLLSHCSSNKALC